MTPLFELRGVTASRASVSTLSDVSLAIPQGRLIVIAGTSGSGKTSLLRLLNRLDAPSAGRIRYRGADLEDLDPLALRRRVGMVFQTPVMLPGSVRDNLRLAREAPDDAYRNVLARADLESDFLERDAGQLSGGEAQRVALARTLLTEPEVVLLDEPTSSLDRFSEAVLEREARRLVNEGIDIVWVTHDVGQLLRLADFVVVIDSGAVVFSGERTAFEASDDPIVRRLLAEPGAVP